ncbi:hypothetical protein E2C01_053200 [Portunus trituberculatus]|uniref:Uncharacterized protein n=1 Tax=Portunus trituberculatus TaxID=210409 RepID=A0A5B7GRD4_PORTR|nr:hypothetical protein [Portunus trituberculatus]
MEADVEDSLLQTPIIQERCGGHLHVRTGSCHQLPLKNRDSFGLCKEQYCTYYMAVVTCGHRQLDLGVWVGKHGQHPAMVGKRRSINHCAT